MRSFIQKSLDAILPVLMFFALAACFIGFMKVVLVPLSPAITLLFVVGLTEMAFAETRTKIMSLTGIAIYAAGWYIAAIQGPIVGTAVCALGVLLWLHAALRGFEVRFPVLVRAAR